MYTYMFQLLNNLTNVFSLEYDFGMFEIPSLEVHKQNCFSRQLEVTANYEYQSQDYGPGYIVQICGALP